MNKKAIVIVLDSVGIGELPDATNYGDKGADTLGHIINTCHPKLPHLMELGLANIDGASFPGRVDAPKGCYRQAARGFRRQGHHDRPLGNRGCSACSRRFRRSRTASRRISSRGLKRLSAAARMGNKPASGTAILDELGEEHHQNRQADRLYLGGQRLPDRGERSGRAAGGAVSRLPNRARAADGRAGGRPRHRASVRRRPRGRVQAHRRSRRDFSAHAAADDVRHSERERQDGLRRGQD